MNSNFYEYVVIKKENCKKVSVLCWTGRTEGEVVCCIKEIYKSRPESDQDCRNLFPGKQRLIFRTGSFGLLALVEEKAYDI